MTGKVVGLKKKSKGPKSLHKTSKQISKTKVLQKYTSDKNEFTCMLTYDVIDELRDIKTRNNLSYQDLIVSMISLYKENQIKK
jgi:hypothetical protein